MSIEGDIQRSKERTAEGERGPHVGLVETLKEVMDSLPTLPDPPKVHTGCFGPSPRDTWANLEIAGLRAEVAELTERHDTQKLLIEEIVSTMKAMTNTLGDMADLAALHKHRLDKLERKAERDTDDLST